MLARAAGIKAGMPAPLVPYVVVGIDQKGCVAWLASTVEMLMREGWGADRYINPLAELDFGQSGIRKLTCHAVKNSKVKILIEPEVSVVF